MQTIRRLFPMMAMVASLLVTPEAMGQTAPSASALFKRAVEHLNANELVEACSLFQQSYGLEPTEAHLGALAHCRDRQGRLATALELYRTYIDAIAAIPENQRQGHAERARLALERSKEIEQQVPRLKLVWQGNIPTDTRITVNGNDVTKRLNAEWPMDPGDHQVIVERAGKTEKTQTVTLTTGRSVVVDLTIADAKPDASNPNKDTNSPEKTAPNEAEGPSSPPNASSPQRAIGIASLSLGGAGLVAGAILGSFAMHDKGIVDASCSPVANGFACTRAGREAVESTRAWGNASTATLAVGGALSVAGIILMVRAAKQDRSTSSKTSAYVLGADWNGGILSVRGVW